MKIEREIKSAEEKLKGMKQRKLEVFRRFLLRCRDCKKVNRASAWIFLQGKYWYSPPSWQSGGYFLDNEWLTCDAICPACKSVIYVSHGASLCSLIFHLKENKLTPKQVFKEVIVGDVEGNARVLQALDQGRLKVTP